MIQDVFIIGATGKVGKTVVRQIFERGDTDSKRHANPTRIVGLASSNNFIYSKMGLLPKQAYAFIDKKSDENIKYNQLSELLEIADDKLKNDKSTFVFVDVTALNEPMTDFHLKVIGQTDYGIVTANKNPIALPSFATFQKLTGDVKRYGYRCSVMAGAHAVPFLQELRDLNDPPLTVEGCFSGTLGYIASELEKGIKFSEILKKAHSNGYTEPHPRDDLSGLDVARKLIVLARTAGFKAEMKDIKLSPFIPRSFLEEDDVNMFMSNVKKLDGDFADKMSLALKNGNTLRYIARMDTRNGIKLNVLLEEVPKESHFGSLQGTLNKLVVVTKVHPFDKPYSLQSQGAGLDVTAQNLRGDLLYLLPDRKNLI